MHCCNVFAADQVVMMWQGNIKEMRSDARLQRFSHLTNSLMWKPTPFVNLLATLRERGDKHKGKEGDK